MCFLIDAFGFSMVNQQVFPRSGITPFMKLGYMDQALIKRSLLSLHATKPEKAEMTWA